MPEQTAPSNSDSGGQGVELAPGVHVPASALRVQYARSSGPGGQNVNKLNTKAELWVPVDQITGLTDAARLRLEKLAGGRLTKERELHITAEATRSQEANREEAMGRLRELLLRAMREPKTRKKTRPSAASKRRRLEAKRKRSEIKSLRRERQ